MKSISLKLESKFAKDIENIIKRNRYSTKTEFIREAIRDKIKELEKEERLKKIDEIFGSSKHRTTDKDLHKAREGLERVYDKKFK